MAIDITRAKQYIAEKTLLQKKNSEKERLQLLSGIEIFLKEHFCETGSEIFLTGSLIRENCFDRYSDIDIVIRNFTGDRILFHSAVSDFVKRPVDVIDYDKSDPDFIKKLTLKKVI